MVRDMEIKNLMTFVQVAEWNSFTKAANVLGYTQSTVSFQIKQLETELGCLLFERINHKITLTDKGRELLEYAQKIGHLTEKFKEDFVKKEEESGHVHIVTSDSICEMMMTRNYYDFYSRYPNISLEFSTANTDEMLEILDHNEADIIFTLDNHIYKKDYIIEKEEPVNLHFVTGASSPLAKRTGLSIHDIIDYPFMLTEKGMAYRRILDEYLATISLEIQPVIEIGRTDLITDCLERGVGISFLPEFVTDQKVKEGKLAYLDMADFEIKIWKQLIYHKNKWISKPLETFIKYVKDMEFDI